MIVHFTARNMELAPETREYSEKRLRALEADIAIDFQGLIKSAVTAAVARPDQIYGFHRSQLRERAAALFYSRHVTAHAGHVVDRNLELAAGAGAAKGAAVVAKKKRKVSPAAGAKLAAIAKARWAKAKASGKTGRFTYGLLSAYDMHPTESLWDISEAQINKIAATGTPLGQAASQARQPVQALGTTTYRMRAVQTPAGQRLSRMWTRNSSRKCRSADRIGLGAFWPALLTR